MEPISEKLRLTRALTIQNLFGSTGSFKSETSAASTRMRDITTRTSGGIHRLLHKAHRTREPHLTIATPPSSSTSIKSPLPITNLAKAFADALTFQRLSDFLVWMLYYDAVDLPESPESWYSETDRVEMRGWVALGEHLTTRDETGYGFDLIVLDSICDRAGLDRKLVQKLLVQFADPQKMVYSQVALAVHGAKAEHSSLLSALEHVKVKLHELYKLCIHLKPTNGSVFQAHHTATEQRLRGYLHLVIGPRVKAVRSGTLIITAATSEHINDEVLAGIKLNYYFEAMQQPRVVPYARYDIPPQSPKSPLDFPASGYIGLELEHARKTALKLTEANQALRQQMADLQHRNEILVASNEKLALKVSKLGRMQPPEYVHIRQPSSAGNWIAENSAAAAHGQETPLAIAAPQDTPYCPQTPSHKPSLSQECIEPVNLTDKYGEIFEGLTIESPSAFRLADLDKDPERHFRQSSSTTTTGAGRRRGSAFTDGMNHGFGTV
ncbi:hypothetical protein NX059_001940 [Plenodomus lindquistii]|nr:hypothetical protein NX059_001940 [Plenodomus lindquistii]